ncbi:Transcriptional regulator [Georgfuchsia toluolica]|uniref:Transcriptional regulator n=1 Tax=Georgfuchsia toluolica TaxID=424218 RepID=A0A916N8M6_9PROT|nr:YafY family protein [Georgfuchsia toluolica]CAG4883437.1 Transcriptional regulator [Georgfuchsia toluolica]
MDRTERFYKIDQLLGEHRVVPFSTFEEKLGVSRATIKRDLEYMRNRLNAPIVWDRERRGYCFAQAEYGASQYELPGLWFSATEIHALLTMQHLLSGLDRGGLLASHVEPLQARLMSLLDSGDGSIDEIRKRIRIVGIASRVIGLDHFSVLGSALLRRKRVQILYYVRARDEATEREVSPQRLVYYRENWYLDAWCHLRNELRSFAIDAIRRVDILETPAKNVPDKTLDSVLGAGYGIFSGRKVQWAKLRFSAQRARWVMSERWHPKQKSRLLADGRYAMELPYSDHRELVMDILRHGPDVEVLAPTSLREEVMSHLKSALEHYKK